MGEVVFASTGNSLNLNQTVVWKQTHGHTGRTVVGNEGYSFAREWANLPTVSEMREHDGAKEFRHFIPEVERVNISPLPLFRGRGLKANETPDSSTMGPPNPDEHDVPEGRYNKAGRAVLYLCDREEGVRREREAWNAGGVPYVQPYRLPADQLKIVDFTQCPEEHFVTAVLAEAENCNVPDRGPDNYLFSQLVAEMVSYHFDGMQVPGTRGERGAWYSNVVVFQPHPNWPEWLEPNVAPYRLD